MDKKRPVSGNHSVKKLTRSQLRRQKQRRKELITLSAVTAAVLALIAVLLIWQPWNSADTNNVPVGSGRTFGQTDVQTPGDAAAVLTHNEPYATQTVSETSATPVLTVTLSAAPSPSPTPTPVPTPEIDPTPTPVPTPTPKPVKLDHLYEIEVDKSKQVVTIYTLDEDGYYTRIVKQFICSTGHCDKVEDGWYRIGEKHRWKEMGNGSYAQYASRISGPYLFHSCCYYSDKINKLKVRYYENLGTNASSGCIRLLCGDAYWIYNNCPHGTPIHVITSGVRDEELLQKLAPPRLVNQNYDPTDPECPSKYYVTPSPDATPEPTAAPGVTPAPTPSWTVHPVLKAWGYC